MVQTVMVARKEIASVLALKMKGIGALSLVGRCSCLSTRLRWHQWSRNTISTEHTHTGFSLPTRVLLISWSW